MKIPLQVLQKGQHNERFLEVRVRSSKYPILHNTDNLPYKTHRIANVCHVSLGKIRAQLYGRWQWQYIVAQRLLVNWFGIDRQWAILTQISDAELETLPDCHCLKIGEILNNNCQTAPFSFVYPRPRPREPKKRYYARMRQELDDFQETTHLSTSFP